MGSPIIFGSNSTANNLQDALGFGNGAGPTVLAPATPVDPTATATSGAKGSLYLNRTTGLLYQKQDSGSTTNWAPFLASVLAATGVASNNNPSITANTPFQFDVVSFDPGSAWNAGTYEYTAPSTGYLLICANIQASGASFSANVYVNGSVSKQICYISTTINLASGSVIIPVTAGDLITLRPDATVTQGNGPSTMHAEFFMVGQAIGASIPSVKFAASEGTGAQTFTTGSGAAITFNTVEFDSALAFSGNTYTIPFDGYYFVQSQILWQSNSSGGRQLDIFVNGTSRCRAFDIARSGGETPGIVSKLIACVATDTVTIVAQQGSGSTLSLFSGSLYNWVSISRVAPL